MGIDRGLLLHLCLNTRQACQTVPISTIRHKKRVGWERQIVRVFSQANDQTGSVFQESWASSSFGSLIMFDWLFLESCFNFAECHACSTTFVRTGRLLTLIALVFLPKYHKQVADGAATWDFQTARRESPNAPWRP